MKVFIDLEKEQGEKLYQGEGDIIIPGGLAYPLTFRRTEYGIPDLLVTYTFSKVDSLVDRIEYGWDMINFDGSKKKANSRCSASFYQKIRTSGRSG